MYIFLMKTHPPHGHCSPQELKTFNQHSIYLSLAMLIDNIEKQGLQRLCHRQSLAVFLYCVELALCYINPTQCCSYY